MSRVLAHQGSSSERPGNTMSAFRLALEQKADGMETDVHLLPDGTLVVHHDGVLGRCEDAEGSIYDYDSRRLETVRIGSKSPWAPQYSDEHLPTLQELLEFLQTNDMYLNLEVKVDTGFIFGDIPGTITKVLNQFHMQNRCILSSFNHRLMQEFRQRSLQYPVGALYHQVPRGINMVDYAKALDFQALHPCYTVVDEMLVKEAKAIGIQVNVWTVDVPDDIERMENLGVDAIITNVPAVARKTLGR